MPYFDVVGLFFAGSMLAFRFFQDCSDIVRIPTRLTGLFFHRHSFSQLPTSCLRPLVIREKKVLFPLLLTICVTFCRGTFFSLPSVLPVSFSLKNCSFVTNLRLFRKAGKIFFLSTGIFFCLHLTRLSFLSFFSLVHPCAGCVNLVK